MLRKVLLMTAMVTTPAVLVLTGSALAAATPSVTTTVTTRYLPNGSGVARIARQGSRLVVVPPSRSRSAKFQAAPHRMTGLLA
jgi:hypothetical protein